MNSPNLLKKRKEEEAEIRDSRNTKKYIAGGLGGAALLGGAYGMYRQRRK